MWQASLHAKRSAFFLDYDGTLVPFASLPHLAVPDPELLVLLERIASSGNTPYLVSGRDRPALEGWSENCLWGLLPNMGLGCAFQFEVQILEGTKVVEVRPAGVHKGAAVLHVLGKQESDFILAMGDDQTDEDETLRKPDSFLPDSHRKELVEIERPSHIGISFAHSFIPPGISFIRTSGM